MERVSAVGADGGSGELKEEEGGVEGAAFEAPECLNCGACCFSKADDYVAVTGDDWSRLGAAAERWAVFGNNRAFMRMEHGHCAALRLESAVETGGVGRFVCSIYETRPQVCRDLARGSGECHGEWTLKRVTAAKAVESRSA